MGSVVAFPEQLSLDRAWDHYVDLTRRYKADPENRDLANELLRAWKVYRDLFDRAEASS